MSSYGLPTGQDDRETAASSVTTRQDDVQGISLMSSYLRALGIRERGAPTCLPSADARGVQDQEGRSGPGHPGAATNSN